MPYVIILIFADTEGQDKVWEYQAEIIAINRYTHHLQRKLSIRFYVKVGAAFGSLRKFLRAAQLAADAKYSHIVCGQRDPIIVSHTLYIRNSLHAQHIYIYFKQATRHNNNHDDKTVCFVVVWVIWSWIVYFLLFWCGYQALLHHHRRASNASNYSLDPYYGCV